jgi:hypothetical protein
MLVLLRGEVAKECKVDCSSRLVLTRCLGSVRGKSGKWKMVFWGNCSVSEVTYLLAGQLTENSSTIVQCSNFSMRAFLTNETKTHVLD